MFRFVAVAVLVLVAISAAQAGRLAVLDPLYSGTGRTTTAFDIASSSRRDEARTLLTRGSGSSLRYLGVGQIAQASGVGIGLALYKTNGQLDTTFQTSGRRLPNFSMMQVTGATIDTVDRIVVVGQGNNQRALIARFNFDGSDDTSLGGSGHISLDFFPGKITRLTRIVVSYGGYWVGGEVDNGTGQFDTFLAQVDYNGTNLGVVVTQDLGGIDTDNDRLIDVKATDIPETMSGREILVLSDNNSDSYAGTLSAFNASTRALRWSTRLERSDFTGCTTTDYNLNSAQIVTNDYFARYSFVVGTLMDNDGGHTQTYLAMLDDDDGSIYDFYCEPYDASAPNHSVIGAAFYVNNLGTLGQSYLHIAQNNANRMGYARWKLNAASGNNIYAPDGVLSGANSVSVTYSAVAGTTPFSAPKSIVLDPVTFQPVVFGLRLYEYDGMGIDDYDFTLLKLKAGDILFADNFEND